MKTFRSCVMSLTMLSLIYPFASYGWAQTRSSFDKSSGGSGQGYPVKLVRYLVPYEAGGGNDVMARIIAGGLTQGLGQQVIVENRPGAGGNIGTEIAARAPADGYTLLQISAANAINVGLYRKLPYDLVRDFAPVTQLASLPAVLVIHPSLPTKSVSGLVKLAKAKPGAINYSSAGTGTPTFFAAELFKRQAGVNLLHVPYRGGGASLTAVISGETSVYFPPLAVALPQMRQGRLRGLAVTSAKRLPMLPELPTIAEAGYPGYESVNWYGLLVPVKTPKETIATVRSAAISVLNNPDVSKRLRDLGCVLIGDQPEEFAAHIKSEIETLAKIIKQTGITAD